MRLVDDDQVGRIAQEGRAMALTLPTAACGESMSSGSRLGRATVLSRALAGPGPSHDDLMTLSKSSNSSSARPGSA